MGGGFKWCKTFFLSHHHLPMPAPAETSPFPCSRHLVGHRWAWPLLGAPSLPTTKPLWASLLLGHRDILAPGPVPLWTLGSSVGLSQAHLLRQTASGLVYPVFCCFPSLYTGNMGPRALLPLSSPNLSRVFVILPSHFRHSSLVRALFSGPPQMSTVSLLPQYPAACGIFTQ